MLVVFVIVMQAVRHNSVVSLLNRNAGCDWLSLVFRFTVCCSKGCSLLCIPENAREQEILTSIDGNDVEMLNCPEACDTTDLKSHARPYENQLAEPSRRPSGSKWHPGVHRCEHKAGLAFNQRLLLLSRGLCVCFLVPCSWFVLGVADNRTASK